MSVTSELRMRYPYVVRKSFRLASERVFPYGRVRVPMRRVKRGKARSEYAGGAPQKELFVPACTF